MAKELDKHIVDAFKKVGFEDKEIREGCWLLEREIDKGGERKEKTGVAWVAYHKFLERVALKAGIVFDAPIVLNCIPSEVAILVVGKDKENNTAWSVGEASDGNLTTISKKYRWSMAEKRGKDRVILKLLGIAGDVYSEEEADDFKNGGVVKKEINQELLSKFERWCEFLKDKGSLGGKDYQDVLKKVENHLVNLRTAGMDEQYGIIQGLIGKYVNDDSTPDEIPF